MRDHIDQNKKAMFENSTQSVKEYLKAMCRIIENEMADAADAAFIRIRRDYMQVVGGVRLPNGEVMPKAERVMRAEVCKLLQESEEVKDEEAGPAGNQDGQSPNGQLQSEDREAADRIKSDTATEHKSSRAPSKQVADSEDTESESNDEDDRNDSDQEGDEDTMDEDEN